MTTGLPRSKILLIGWDAADWKIISPLLDAGKMPALEGMINEGVMANLATIRPILSPMLWTSIATGKRAYKHGIHGFTEPTPDGSGIRPITNLSRKTKAFWNIFNQSGMQGNVVGWWPSNPAEPINGAMVSDHFQKINSIDPRAPWPMASGTVHPEELAEELAELRFHPGELIDSQVRPFIPHADEVDQDNDRRMGGCMNILAECTSLHAAATHLMQTRDWDYTAIYLDSIDHFCHGFMRYHPPRQEFVPERDFKLYSNVIEAAYRYHDMMLATLLQLAGEDATVVLLSDHGFHPDHLRLQNLPNEPAAPASEHRDLGIFVMKGPGVRRDERIYGASILDICPTLLAAAGLPLGEDMDGAPLLQAWDQPPQIEWIPSWDKKEGESGQHPSDTTLDPRESQQAIQQMVELGYIEQPDEDDQTAIEHTVRELSYNSALAYMDGDRHAEAATILADLHGKYPDEIRFGMRLLFCYRALDRIAEMKPLLEDVKDLQAKKAAKASRRLSELVELYSQRPERNQGTSSEEADARADDSSPKQSQAGHDAPGPTVPATTRDQDAIQALADLESGKESDEEDRDAAREEFVEERRNLFKQAFSRATPRERSQLTQLVKNSQPRSYSFDYLDGYVLLAEGKVEESLECFKSAEQAEPNRPWLPIQIGEAYLQLRRWEDAEQSFLRAIEIDPENPHAFAGLSHTYLGRRNNLQAADAALSAVALQHHFPFAHYLLGTALHRIGRIESAVEALEVAISINPNFTEAHSRLATIYGRRLNNPEKAERHLSLAKQAAENQARLGRSSVKPEVVGIAATDDQLSEQQENLSDWIPDRPALQPRLDLSEVVTVVTGLPRSGTSMLMQMLEAGGIPSWTDGERTPDDDNPRGYFEHERVKKLRTDASWIPEARGKAVKIITQLLPTLPRGQYRLIYVDRCLDEVIASQRVMLSRRGRQGGALPDDQLKATFQKQIRIVGEMLQASNVPVLKVKHRDCIENPEGVAADVSLFLGGRLDETRMAATVDRSLYRQRTEQVTPMPM